MEIYALFDDQGLPKGFYTPVIHAKIPHGAVRITTCHWHEFIRHQGFRRWDGEKPVEYIPPQTPSKQLSRSLWRLLHPIAILRNKLIHLPR